MTRTCFELSTELKLPDTSMFLETLQWTLKSLGKVPEKNLHEIGYSLKYHLSLYSTKSQPTITTASLTSDPSSRTTIQ